MFARTTLPVAAASATVVLVVTAASEGPSSDDARITPIQVAHVDADGVAETVVRTVEGRAPAASETGPEDVQLAPVAASSDEQRPEPSLASRLRGRLAMLEEPSDAAYAEWYDGSDLGDLARVAYDLHNAQAWLGAEATLPHMKRHVDGAGLGAMRDAAESLAAESDWLGRRVERLVNTPPTPTRTRYATFDDEALGKMFRTPRDRYALKIHLRAELAQAVEDAAREGFVAARARVRAGTEKNFQVML